MTYLTTIPKRLSCLSSLLLFWIPATFCQTKNKAIFTPSAHIKSIHLTFYDSKVCIEGYPGDSVTVQLENKSCDCLANNNSLNQISEHIQNDSFLVKIDSSNSDLSIITSIIDQDKYSLHIKIPSRLTASIECYSTCPSDSLVIENLNHLVKIGGEVKEINLVGIKVNQKLYIDTKSDNIYIDHLVLPANTEAESPDSPFSCYISTNGNVKFSLKKDTNTQLTVFSKGGKVYSNLPFKNIKQHLTTSPYLTGTAFSGVLNNPSSGIYVRTNYGNISLQQSE